MDISRVKYNLGKNVRLTLPRHSVDCEYILSGCIIRRNQSGEFFYQAELQDLNSRSVVIAELDSIAEINVGSPTIGGRKLGGGDIDA